MDTISRYPQWYPFTLFNFGVSLLKLNIRKKGTLIIIGLLGNLVLEVPRTRTIANIAFSGLYWGPINFVIAVVIVNFVWIPGVQGFGGVGVERHGDFRV